MKNWNWWFLSKCLLSFLFVCSLCFILLFAYRESLPHYNTTLGHEKKFVWFRVSKVGSKTIANILNTNEAISSFNYDAPYDSNDYPDYFKFAFVRNPWDRVVSCYQNRIVTADKKRFKECHGKNFDCFVRYIDKQDLLTADKHIKLQTASMPLEEMDFIGRLENFSEDLPYVLERLGCKNNNYLHKNRTDHAHYSTYYTDETREIIARKYKADIDYFGYTFETVNE